MNAFVVDPDGDMYNCWNEIGEKSACIGNIADLKQRGKYELMNEIRWLTWGPFEYSKCLKCKLLPICMGGCGYRAMFVNKDVPDCTAWKYNLEHYVQVRYQREKNIKVAGRES